MSFDNNSSSSVIERDNPLFWSRVSPVDCNAIRIIGIVQLLVAFIGSILNGSLIQSFVKHKELRTPPNIFIFFIAVIGFTATVPVILVATSNIYCRWLYGKAGCLAEGFMVFFYGGSTSYILCAVSLSRCYIIVKPFDAKKVTVKKCLIVAIVATVMALVWTIAPLLGWNEYTLEGALTSCCVNWYSRSPLFVSFTVTIFIFVYFIPLTILVTTNSIIFLGIKRMKDKIQHGIKTELSQRRVEMERRIVKSVVVTILGFFMAWTPYGVSSFISAFSSTLTPPLVISLCAIFAKASVVWIPLLYISTSTQYKLKFVDLKDMEKTATSQGGGGDGQTQINSQTATTVRRTPQVQVEEPSNKHSQDFTAINDETNNKSAT